MKITIVQGAFFPVPPIRGGAIEKIWFAMGREFARRGHEVTHISRTFPGLPHEETIDGVRHLRVNGFDTPPSPVVLKFLDLIYTLRVLRFLPPADILVTHTFWLPVLAPRRSRGHLYVHVARTPRGQLRFYARAGRLQTVSHATLAAMEREVPGLRSKLKCIPNPLTKTSDQFTEPPTGERLKRLLYVGRLHPEKGVELLLRALVKVPAQLLSGWSLHLVGSAEFKDGGRGPDFLARMKEIARNLACTVEWKGPIFDPMLLAQEYREAALFLYPSLAEKGETFGLAPLEAMAEGAPPLVSALACFGDFVENKKTGFIFDHRTERPEETLKEKLIELISHTDLLAATGKRAYDRARDFSLDRIAGEYLDDFTSLLHAP
ncbi:MAG: glycosyltransferase family 4 protein [Methylacidiphilales bacterium]|nr:glycosyltransferase family 4 protein [Candidatus Methylacidiphilales bacterium]